MDQDCKQRSFQNTSMSYATLVDKVCCAYSDYHAMVESGADETIDIPLIQYEETDWAFLQRVASRQNAVLVPDVYVSSPSFHFGFPQQNKALIIEKSQYTIGISPKWATQSKHQKLDYLYYKIEEKVNYPIGKQVQLNGRILWIIEKEIRLEQGECIYYYTLGGPAFFYQEVQYNQHITGLSILGTVLESAGETVKLHLDIDDEQDVGTAYPYWWTPPTGNLMYCIPEVGTRVSLYFGCQDESCAKAVNCVRTNASSYEGFSDPAKRSLSTVKGGAFDLYPTCTCLHNTSNLLSLDDDGGIIISSQLPISMIAPKISIEAKTQLSISSKSQIAIAKMDSVMAEPLAMLSLFNQIDTLSQQFTQVEGSFKEPLKQIQDEPQKGEIDWGKLALNVLGGLAVVALACTGVGLVFGGGLVLGCAIGGAVAVGACAVGDIASGNVSGFENYAYAALSGVVTGAIFSGVSGCSLFTKLGNMKSLLGKVGQSALLGGTGFGVGTLDSMGRQYVRSGTIDYQQALIDGAFMGGLAGGGYFISQLGPVNKLFGKLANTPSMQKLQQLDQKIARFFDSKSIFGHYRISNQNLTIASRNTSRGKANAIKHFDVDLNTRQQNLLDQLPDFNSSVVIKKSDVNLSDLSALTAKTGDEFAMFTKGGERLIIRGDTRGVPVDIELAKQLYDAGYKWSGHTHPGNGFNVKMPSDGDLAILKEFHQFQSVIYDNSGQFNIFTGE